MFVDLYNLMTKKNNVAVIILNWNSYERTANCLQRLIECQIFNSDIFVVDNGSTDDSVSVLSMKFPTINIICNVRNLGFGGGCNVAIKKILSIKSSYESDNKTSCYQYILLLNTDAGLDQKDIGILVATLDENPRIGVVGPLIVEKNNPTSILSAGGLDPSVCINTYNSNDVKFAKKIDCEEPFQVYYVSGTVALLRTSVLSMMGLFDEDYFFSCEMADLCERIKEKGFICAVTPRARAWHDMEEAGCQRATLYLYYILRNRFLFIRKFKRKYIFLLFVYWVIIGQYCMLKALFFGRFTSARAIGIALKDGVVGRYGGRNELFD
jgi:GT2 family glycosyltransferase